jgi:uncharacterized protein YjbI with pentapeptide repeats
MNGRRHTMTKEELKVVLDAHAKWARGETDGKRANLGGANLESADLESAYLEGANLRGANLGGADLESAYLESAYLEGANLGGANLRGANLGGANLRGANLGGANLRGAYLEGANLRGANLRGADLGNDRRITGLITRVTRIIDPYEFFAWRTDKGDFIKAGCRFMTIEEFRAHVAKTYPGTPKAEETLAILDFIESRFKAVGGTATRHPV